MSWGTVASGSAGLVAEATAKVLPTLLRTVGVLGAAAAEHLKQGEFIESSANPRPSTPSRHQPRSVEEWVKKLKGK